MTYTPPLPEPVRPEPIGMQGSKDFSVAFRFAIDPTTKPPTFVVVGPANGDQDPDGKWFQGRQRKLTLDAALPFTPDEYLKLLALRSSVLDRVAIEDECLPKDRRYDKRGHGLPGVQ